MNVLGDSFTFLRSYHAFDGYARGCLEEVSRAAGAQLVKRCSIKLSKEDAACFAASLQWRTFCHLGGGGENLVTAKAHVLQNLH